MVEVRHEESDFISGGDVADDASEKRTDTPEYNFMRFYYPPSPTDYFAIGEF